MTDNFCELCGTERIGEEEFCHKSGCGYHFENQPTPDKEEVKQEPSESQSQPTYQQSETEWEKNQEEMQKEQEQSEAIGILVLPDGKEISFENNQKTVGRSDVSQFVELETDSDPRRVSNQQFTIWREHITSLMPDSTFLYFIEDRATSVQAKASTNGTKVNGEKITDEVKQELHHDDKIEFARIPECVATFKIKTSGGSPNSPRIQTS